MYTLYNLIALIQEANEPCQLTLSTVIYILLHGIPFGGLNDFYPVTSSYIDTPLPDHDPGCGETTSVIIKTVIDRIEKLQFEHQNEFSILLKSKMLIFFNKQHFFKS